MSDNHGRMDRDDALAAALAVESGQAPSGSVIIAITGPHSLTSTTPPRGD